MPMFYCANNVLPCPAASHAPHPPQARAHELASPIEHIDQAARRHDMADAMHVGARAPSLRQGAVMQAQGQPVGLPDDGSKIQAAIDRAVAALERYRVEAEGMKPSIERIRAATLALGASHGRVSGALAAVCPAAARQSMG